MKNIKKDQSTQQYSIQQYISNFKDRNNHDENTRNILSIISELMQYLDENNVLEGIIRDAIVSSLDNESIKKEMRNRIQELSSENIPIEIKISDETLQKMRKEFGWNNNKFTNHATLETITSIMNKIHKE